MNQNQNNDPVILIVGKTGSGKSTLGNMLIGDDNDSFEALASMDSVTNSCQAKTMFINEVRYSIIDTPGFFDSQTPTEQVQKHIIDYFFRCACGIKAILIVFEATRLTHEQLETLELMKKFFGNDALREYAIVVLSRPNSSQMDDREKMKCIWNIEFTDFVERLNGRWGISPNPDFSSNPNYGVYLNEIKRLIALTPGVYTSEKSTGIWQQYVANMRQKQEKEESAKKEYEENLRNEGKADANKKWEDANKKLEDRLRKIEKDYYEKQYNLLAASIAIGVSGSLAYFLTILYPKTCIFMAALYTSQNSQPNNEGNFSSHIRNWVNWVKLFLTPIT